MKFLKRLIPISWIFLAQTIGCIRLNNSLISCRRIAQNLPEGWGHEFAAGARFKSNPLNRNEIIKELEEAVLKSVVDTSL